MILPTVTTLSIDALAAVPNEYREGSYALGCTRWQTVCHVVLKSALPSLMTAVILGMTRAFGETLAVQMVTGGVEKAMPGGFSTRRPHSPPRSRAALPTPRPARWSTTRCGAWAFCSWA